MAKCDKCTVAFDTVATLRFDSLYAPDVSVVVAVSADGNVAVSPSEGAGEIYMFDGSGALRGRGGRKGAGPGEFRSVQALLFGAGDSLYVVDARNRAVTVYSPGLSMVRTYPSVPLGRIQGRAWVDDTTIFLQGMSKSADLIGFYGHSLTTGGISRPLFEATTVVDTRDIGFDYRPVAGHRGGGLWMSEFRAPTLRLFNESADTVRALQVEMDWPEEPPRNAERFEGWADTRPGVRGLSEDPAGRLWMLTSVPEDPLPDIAVSPETQWTKDVIAGLADYTLHAIDSHTGEVTASKTFDHIELYVLDQGMGFLVGERAGEPAIYLVRFVVR